MISTVKEIIRNIKLYELGIKDKLDGYDELMSLRGLNSLKPEDINVTHYGKPTNGIKFTYYDTILKCIFIKYETWKSIESLFKLSYDEVEKLTMWAIGSDPNLEGVPTRYIWWRFKKGCCES